MSKKVEEPQKSDADDGVDMDAVAARVRARLGWEARVPEPAKAKGTEVFGVPVKTDDTLKPGEIQLRKTAA